MALSKQTDVAKVAEQSEVKHLMALDQTPWYKKPNLRRLYFCLVPSVLGCEMTSGYDGMARSTPPTTTIPQLLRFVSRIHLEWPSSSEAVARLYRSPFFHSTKKTSLTYPRLQQSPRRNLGPHHRSFQYRRRRRSAHCSLHQRQSRPQTQHHDRLRDPAYWRCPADRFGEQ